MYIVQNSGRVAKLYINSIYYKQSSPLQTVSGMYYAPALATSQAGSYPVFPVPSYDLAGYFGPAPLPITIQQYLTP